MSNLPCPCCGFLTLQDSYGSYEICPLCEWEDDGIQLSNPTSGGGANTLSLAEAQVAAIQKFPLQIQKLNEFQRSARWRPLSATEIEAANNSRQIQHWHSQAIITEEDAYWL